MPHKPIAVVAAMRRELAPLLAGRKPQEIRGVQIFELRQALVAIGGMGAKSARRAAELAIQHAQPSLLLSAGVAGAVSPKLKAGDVGQVREIVDVATGLRYSTTGGDWLLASVEAVSDTSTKHGLLMRYGADVVDMEAAAVARVAHMHGVEFACVKSIFDDAELAMPPLTRFIDGDGKFATGQFLGYVAVHPRWWGTLYKFKKNSKIAAANLCQAVAHLSQEYCSSMGEMLSQ